MTRDQAIAAAIKSKEQWGGGSSEAWLVNALEALGVLKIDRPKTLAQKITECLCNPIGPFEVSTALHIEKILDQAGLKIVEK